VLWTSGRVISRYQELHFSELQIFLEPTGVEGEQAGAAAACPSRRAAGRLADGEHRFHFASRGQIGGKIFLGMPGKSDDAFGGNVFASNTQFIAAAPALCIAAKLDDALSHWRLTNARHTASHH